MTTKSTYHYLTTAVTNALRSGIPILKLTLNDCTAELTYKRKGDVIDDNACLERLEALETGVFMRADRISHNTTSKTRLYLCKLDDIDIGLSHFFHHLSPEAAESIAIDAIWQSAQWQGIRTRRPGRQAQLKQ